MFATVVKTESFLASDKRMTTVYLKKEDGTSAQFTAPSEDCTMFTVGKKCEETTSLPFKPCRAPRKPDAPAPTTEVAAQSQPTTPPTVPTASPATAKRK